MKLLLQYCLGYCSWRV